MRQRAFLRWLSGQFGLFAQFESLPESRTFREVITRYLDRHPHLNLEDMNNIRAFYGEFTETLRKKGLIDFDDAHTFKTVYPLFEPSYVFYDQRKNEANLTSVAVKALKP